MSEAGPFDNQTAIVAQACSVSLVLSKAIHPGGRRVGVLAQRSEGCRNTNTRYVHAKWDGRQVHHILGQSTARIFTQQLENQETKRGFGVSLFRVYSRLLT